MHSQLPAAALEAPHAGQVARSMQYTYLGKTGVKVSRLCLGCMSYGDPKWRPWVLDRQAAMPFFRLAVESGSIPILPGCQEICKALGLDPLGLLASGALLVTLPAGQVPALFTALETEKIDGWEIGQMLAPEEGLVLFGVEGEQPLPQFQRDELARYLSATA